MFVYCKFGNFCECFLFSRNFADAKFHENKTLGKWRNGKITLFLLTQVDCAIVAIFLANMSLNAIHDK